MPGLTNRRMHCFGDDVRVTVCATQGGRKYMEDRVHIHTERTSSGEIDFMFFGVYDGHGGAQASEFTKEHLMNNIVDREDLFRSSRDEDVCEAIRLGFLETHNDMLKVVGAWPRTASGYQSTAGTTASIAFVMNGKLYTGHVGDSAIVLGRRTPDGTDILAERLTVDHKPDSPEELKRIERHGGQVLNKAGVMRVVWRRTIRGHEGPVRRSTQQECIPFLAVARSLASPIWMYYLDPNSIRAVTGDLWSYNADTEEYVVSPEPDTAVHRLTAQDVCIVLASDGLWNVIRDQYSISIVDAHEWRELDEKQIEPPHLNRPVHANHSRWLIRHALRCWGYMRADNITAITVIFDPLHSELDGGSACVLDPSVDSWQLDELFTQQPAAMVRITNSVTQQLRTAPVELVYNGASDPVPQPANGSSFLASQRVTVDFHGPGFSQHTAQPQYRQTPQRAFSSMKAIPLPFAPILSTRKSSTSDCTDDLSEAEPLGTDNGNNDDLIFGQSVESVDVDSSHCCNGHTRPRFYCHKSDLASAKVPEANTMDKSTLLLTDDDKPQAATSEQQRKEERKTETPPPPDPKPSQSTPLAQVCMGNTPTTSVTSCRRQAATSVRRTRHVRHTQTVPSNRYNLRRAGKHSNLPESAGSSTPGTTCALAADSRTHCKSAPPKPRHPSNTPPKRRASALRHRKEFAENIEESALPPAGKCKRLSDPVEQQRPQSATDMRPDTRTCDTCTGPCTCVQISAQYNSVFARLNLHSTACTTLSSVCRQSSSVEEHAGGVLTRHRHYSTHTAAVFPRSNTTGHLTTKRKLFGASADASEPAAKRSRIWNWFGLFSGAGADSKCKSK